MYRLKAGNIPLFLWPVFLILAILAILMLRLPESEQVAVPQPPQLYSSSFNLIGTGNRLGTYYPAGHILADWFNGNLAAQPNSFRSFKAFETNGSIDNLNLISHGKIALAMIEGRIVKEGAARSDKIRLVWPLWLDVVHILQGPKLVGKSTFPDDSQIFPGQKSSSTERTSKEIYQAFGRVLPATYGQLPPEDLLRLLKSGLLGYANIQAGMPNRTVSDALIFHDCSLVNFSDEQINNLLPAISTAQKFVIPPGFYGEKQPEIQTIAMANFLVTTSDASEELIELVAEQVVRASANLRMRHQALADIPSDSTVALKMMQDLGVGIHAGSMKFINRNLKSPESAVTGN